jgi:hypothetical protein
MKKLLLKYSLLAALLWTVIIFILCSTPGQYITTTSWLELLSFDKFVHATIFFTLTCLWLLVFAHNGSYTKSTILLTIISCVAYGGLLEILQANVFSQRSGDWLDFIANTFGCMMGLWFFDKKKGILIN